MKINDQNPIQHVPALTHQPLEKKSKTAAPQKAADRFAGKSSKNEIASLQKKIEGMKAGTRKGYLLGMAGMTGIAFLMGGVMTVNPIVGILLYLGSVASIYRGSEIIHDQVLHAGERLDGDLKSGRRVH